MKHAFLVGMVVLVIWVWGLALAASTYELTHSTVSSGGAMSVGGRYTLGGTAGQVDAGQVAGGTYTLGGGFWGDGGASQNGVPRYLAFVAR